MCLNGLLVNFPQNLNKISVVKFCPGSLSQYTHGYLKSASFSACRPLQVKIAYVNFVNHCYVDTEVEMKEIYTSNHIWNLFENFLVDMARVSAPVWLKRNLCYLLVAVIYWVFVCVCVVLYNIYFFPPPRYAAAPQTEIELILYWRNMSQRSS